MSVLEIAQKMQPVGFLQNPSSAAGKRLAIAVVSWQ